MPDLLLLVTLHVQPLMIQSEHTIANVLSYLYHENVPDLTVAKRCNVHSCKVFTDADLQENVSKNLQPGEVRLHAWM